MPFGGIQTGPLQHPFSDRDNKTSLFCDRYEIQRRHQAAIGVTPANQRFTSCNTAGFESDNRLKFERELAADKGLAKIELKRAALLHARIHFRFEKSI